MNKRIAKELTLFEVVLAYATDHNAVPDNQRELCKQLAEMMVENNKFLQEGGEFESHHALVGDEGEQVRQPAGFLMSNVHKVWDTKFEGKTVKIPFKIYDDPKRCFQYILKDRWTPTERMELLESALDFILENKEKELVSDGENNQQFNTFISAQSLADELMDTDSVELTADILWSRLNYLLQIAHNDKLWTGTSLTEGHAFYHMIKLLEEVKDTESFKQLYAPKDETTAPVEGTTNDVEEE